MSRHLYYTSFSLSPSHMHTKPLHSQMTSTCGLGSIFRLDERSVWSWSSTVCKRAFNHTRLHYTRIKMDVYTCRLEVGQKAEHACFRAF